MKSTIDMIKNIQIRIDMNNRGRKNKKVKSKLFEELRLKFNEIFVQEDDSKFFEDFSKIVGSEMIEPYISSNFFPKSMDDYAKFLNIFGNADDFKYEIRWLVACVLYRKDVINEFIIQRERYDDYILLNKYEEALEIVDYVDKKYGVSYWSSECRFFLYNRLGRNIKELEKKENYTVFSSVLNFYELKNRESVTSDEYYYIVEKEIIGAKKNVRNENEAIEFFNYMVSGIEYITEPKKIMLAISVIQRCSLIDRYLFIINTCNELMNQSKTNYFYKCMKKYIVLLQGIKDDNLTAIRFVFDTEENRRVGYILKSGLDSAKTKFILGEIKEAREEAIRLLESFPNNTEAMSLLVETNILINDDEVQFKGTNLGRLLKYLVSVYKLNAQRDDAMEKIGKLALTCSQSTWARSIMSNIYSRCFESNGFDYGHHKILCNLQYLDIETLMYSLTEEECKKFIEEKLNKEDPYVQFRKALVYKEYHKASSICGIEGIKDYLFVCDSSINTMDKIKHLHSIDGTNSSIDIIAMKNFLSFVNLEQDWENVFRIAANLVIDNIYTALFIPWEKLILYIDSGPTEIRRNISTPILYYIYAYYVERDKKDDLGIVCSDFFDLEGIEYPSQMKKFTDKYDKKMLIYFLRNVCIAKTMDDAIYIFENPQERDQERVEICNFLILLDSKNKKIYEDEIKEITQKLMINNELKIIDESRIHVNVEGIKERLINAEGSTNRFDNNLKNDFQRYMFYQDDKVKQWYRLLEGEEKNKFKESHETADRLLKEMVQKIRDAFVSSGEYGLNGYLSLNIRHNTLEDELRSPLQRTMLYAKKDNIRKTYIVPACWMQYIEGDDKKVLCDAFKNFYLETEEILDKLKSDYIQIRTELKGDKGIFDYRLIDKDYIKIAYCADDIKTFEEFFDMVVSQLWEKTEKNLEQIKYVIRNEIKEDYMKAFTKLRNEVAVLHNKTIERELQQKISEAETDMQNVFEHICYWFQRSNESKHNDFNLQFAFDLGLKTIRNIHPEVKIDCERMEDTVDDKISGQFIKSFNGIFYNLFDNIYKNATAKNGIFYVKYALKNLDGNITIYIENDFDCTKNMEADICRVEKAKEIYRTEKYAEKAKEEGGTGIPKICKIIKYDLRKNPNLDFGYKESENKFYMKIEF